MEQLTKNQAVATSQEAVQNQNEPQLRDENAHNDKSVHGVLNPTYQAGLRRDAVQRSEERFSRNAETDLVCRLLLEKKKNTVEAMHDVDASHSAGEIDETVTVYIFENRAFPQRYVPR